MRDKYFCLVAGIVLILLGMVRCEDEEAECTTTSWSQNQPKCAKGLELIWEEKIIASGDRRAWCCKPGSEMATTVHRDVTKCQVTKCLPSRQLNPCLSGFDKERTYKGKVIKYEEVSRDYCELPNKSTGAAVYCCQGDSKETVLSSLMGAGANEFPHMAHLSSYCGSTIYNKEYLITAAHCIMDDGQPPIPNMVVKVGRNLVSTPMPENEYKVVEAIPHPGYSGLKGDGGKCKVKEAGLCNDIAIVKLERPIKFGPHVKSLPIAPRRFNESKYAGDVLILGWGTTETGEVSEHLQKANFIIRSDYTCFDRNNPSAPYAAQHNIKNELLCVGGLWDGTYSPIAGGGDSGGPAICRDSEGQPVLCGITSYGGGDEMSCAKYQDEQHCPPSVYAEIDVYRDWIKMVAGEQHEKTFHKVQLYGEVVNARDYSHQVRIRSTGKEKSCGGTLIAPNLVVTTAQCVTANIKSKKGLEGLKVWVGVEDISKLKSLTKSKAYGMKSFKRLPGYKVVGPSKEVMKNQTIRVMYSDQFFQNDLAVIKLKENVNISQEALPRLPKRGEIFTGSAVEFAYPRNTKRGGEMRKRDFTLLNQDECQKRMDQLRLLRVDFKIEPGTLCGVEKYSGGSKCDRELGGGLICKGNDGKDVLCGVQKFRMCEFSLPNAFENVALASSFLQGELKKV